jgi:TRAP transporter 4TM/12TM fusion protein
LTETEYLKIALMNVIPAFLFFFFLIYMVDLEAVKSGLKGLEEDDLPKVRTVLARGWHHIIPLVVVLGLLFQGYSPDFGAFWGTVAAFLLSFRHRETWMGPRKVIDALITGAHNNTSAGAAIGTLGIIIGGIILSGLGLKFSAVLIEFAGGSLFLTVVLVTLISIIIGMGSSTTGSYIILAVVAAPALIQLGVEEIPAHLVVFYAACLSNITPPVCVSAFAAAAIAGADPMKTGFAALKFGVTLALIPFSFVYAPELLLYGSTGGIVITVASYLFGYTALAMAIQGTEPLRGGIALWQRGLFVIAALCLLFPTTIWVDLVGLALLVTGWAPSLLRRPGATGQASPNRS